MIVELLGNLMVLPRSIVYIVGIHNTAKQLGDGHGHMGCVFKVVEWIVAIKICNLADIQRELLVHSWRNHDAVGVNGVFEGIRIELWQRQNVLDLIQHWT